MSDTPRTDAEALKSRPPFALVTRKYAEQLERELNAANAELERERIRLAACGVVADANTPESAKKWRNMRDEYRSASCDGVARAVDREMRLRRALQKIGNDWCVPPMIADEALTAIEDVRENAEAECVQIDVARQNNILQDYNKILGQELQDTKRERDELKAYADKLADGLPEGMLPKDVENLRNANAGLAEDLRKAKLERGEALAALKQTCATNTEIRRELEEARREIAKLKASSNENYWELSRQRGNMLHALHEISAAVKRGMRQGGITIGETEVLGRMEGRE